MQSEDSKIVAHAGWTGLDIFRKEFPDRTFDVGIAEQHAAAAGLPTENLFKPYAAIYQHFFTVNHDVVIQCLPVRFTIDRAGYWSRWTNTCWKF